MPARIPTTPTSDAPMIERHDLTNGVAEVDEVHTKKGLIRACPRHIGSFQVGRYPSL
jgi:hypothetical protein